MGWVGYCIAKKVIAFTSAEGRVEGLIEDQMIYSFWSGRMVIGGVVGR